MSDIRRSVAAMAEESKQSRPLPGNPAAAPAAPAAPQQHSKTEVLSSINDAAETATFSPLEGLQPPVVPPPDKPANTADRAADIELPDVSKSKS